MRVYEEGRSCQLRALSVSAIRNVTACIHRAVEGTRAPLCCMYVSMLCMLYLSMVLHAVSEYDSACCIWVWYSVPRGHFWRNQLVLVWLCLSSTLVYKYCGLLRCLDGQYAFAGISKRKMWGSAWRALDAQPNFRCKMCSPWIVGGQSSCPQVLLLIGRR